MAGLITGDPRAAAESSWEAVMVSVIVVLALIATAFGVCIGAFFRLSLAIGWEDRRKWSLRRDAPSISTRAARTLVGISRYGRE